jgi:hypothetical protein
MIRVEILKTGAVHVMTTEDVTHVYPSMDAVPQVLRESIAMLQAVDVCAEISGTGRRVGETLFVVYGEDDTGWLPFLLKCSVVKASQWLDSEMRKYKWLNTSH